MFTQTSLFSFTSIVYYFTPMILVASMSIVSGVIVAALYHQEKSRPVPLWLRKISGLILSPRSSMSATVPSDAVETRQTTVMDLSFSAERKPCTTYDSESKAVPLNDERQRKGGQDGDDAAADFGAEWQRCAVAIDRLTGKIACAVTLIAVIVTISLLVATSS